MTETGERRLSFRLPDAAGGERLDRALAQASALLAEAEDGPPLSRARLQTLMRAGRVRLDGIETKDPSAPASPGSAVEIWVPEPEPARPRPEALPLAVLYEDAHLIVIDKPAGMAVHPAPGTPSGTLVNALLHHCRDSLSGVGGVLRPGIVHRLDKDTSGVLVAAKTDAAHQGLSALFAAHDLERRYLALLARRPDPPAGRIETQIGRARFDRQRMAVLKSGGRRAETRYRVLETFQTGSHPPRAIACKAALELQTGRTHQIRVHMAHLGAAVLADPLYGSSAPAGPVREAIAAAGLRRQALHAQRLAFHHPVTGERLAFETDPPEDMGRLETELRSRFFSV